MDAHTIFECGRSQRYHTNPRIARFGQTTADHQWGVAAIILALNPTASRNLIIAALLHDCGERWAGDLPYPFKAANPEAAKMHEEVEFQLARQNGVAMPEITEDDAQWLKLADRLEAQMYVRLVCPHEIDLGLWDSNRAALIDAAERLGVRDQVERVMEEKGNA